MYGSVNPIKSKKSEIKQWISENRGFIAFSVILSICSIPLTLVILIYGLLAAVAKETMLPSLIEAEATILGFFGLIAVYALTSFDSRIDRLEEQLFDLREKHWELNLPSRPETEWQILGEQKIAFFNKRLSKIKERKRKVVHSASITGAYLIGSILSSILALGVPNDEWSFYLCSLSIALFLASIGVIVWMIYNLGKSPEAVSE